MVQNIDVFTNNCRVFVTISNKKIIFLFHNHVYKDNNVYLFLGGKNYH